MASFRTALFDFDGTIANTKPGIYNSIKYALAQEKIPVGDESRLDYFIGPPLYDGFSTIYLTDEATTEELVRQYRVYYGEKGVYECELYPGIPEMLRAVRAAGLKTAVVSSKPKHFLDIVLPHLGIDSLFDAVVGPEMENTNSDKTRLIADALYQIWGTADEHTAMCGDRFYDMYAAKKAGVVGIGTPYGFGSPEELTGAGAESLADSPAELQQILLS